MFAARHKSNVVHQLRVTRVSASSRKSLKIGIYLIFRSTFICQSLLLICHHCLDASMTEIAPCRLRKEAMGTIDTKQVYCNAFRFRKIRMVFNNFCYYHCICEIKLLVVLLQIFWKETGILVTNFRYIFPLPSNFYSPLPYRSFGFPDKHACAASWPGSINYWVIKSAQTYFSDFSPELFIEIQAITGQRWIRLAFGAHILSFVDFVHP